jgi:hypothetical protein
VVRNRGDTQARFSRKSLAVFIWPRITRMKTNFNKRFCRGRGTTQISQFNAIRRTILETQLWLEILGGQKDE